MSILKKNIDLQSIFASSDDEDSGATPVTKKTLHPIRVDKTLIRVRWTEGGLVLRTRALSNNESRHNNLNSPPILQVLNHVL